MCFSYILVFLFSGLAPIVLSEYYDGKVEQLRLDSDVLKAQKRFSKLYQWVLITKVILQGIVVGCLLLCDMWYFFVLQLPLFVWSAYDMFNLKLENIDLYYRTNTNKRMDNSLIYYYYFLGYICCTLLPLCYILILYYTTGKVEKKSNFVHAFFYSWCEHIVQEGDILYKYV